MNSFFKPQRVAKIIAQTGLCSRRQAERLIEEKQVFLDGKLLTTPAIGVDDPSRLTVSGKSIPLMKPIRLWCYHKPKGLITTHYDPEGRPTVFDALPFQGEHIISVGRLDLYSEGLLLLTNHGGLSRYLEHPSTRLERYYRVQVRGHPKKQQLDALHSGITIKGIRYLRIKAEIESWQGSSCWLAFTLVEGKNREIRRIAESFEWKITRLIREAYGPFRLNSLKPGEVKEVPQSLIDLLLTTMSNSFKT